MESVKTNTEVRFDPHDKTTVAVKKVHVAMGFVIMVLVFAIQVGTATFYVTNVKSEQDAMRDDITELQNKNIEVNQDNEEILRLLQEISYNLQDVMERQKLTYKTIPKTK